MLTVTTPALDRLSDRLTTHDGVTDVAMRFTRREGGWTLGPDRPRPGDTSFMHNGRNVLVLDQAVSKGMADLILDVRHTDAGARLKLRRVKSPNA